MKKFSRHVFNFLKQLFIVLIVFFFFFAKKKRVHKDIVYSNVNNVY